MNAVLDAPPQSELPAEEDFSAVLAAFAAQTPAHAIPDSLFAKVEEYFLDFLGHTAYSAQHADSSSAFIGGIRNMDPSGRGSTVIGRAETYSKMQAILLNGAFAHSMDFDDTFVRGMLHPGAPIIPMVLALGEEADVSGHAMADAIAMGYEIACRIGVAIHPENAYDRGFHITAVAGIFGAVAAAGRLLKMTSSEIANAFGIAGSLASGSMQYLSNGSWNKRLHPGFAGHSALMAISLARAGVIGAEDPIAGRYGILTGYTDQPYPQLLTLRLGEEWLAAETAIKPYPSCRMAHGAIDVCLELRGQMSAEQRHQARIRIDLSPKAYDLVGEPLAHKIQARNIVDAQFSVYFQVASAWLYGSANWQSYERIGTAEIEKMAAQIEVHVDPQMTHGGARVQISGPAALKKELRVPSGEPSAPLSRSQIRDKFISLASAVYGQTHAAQVAEQGLDLRRQTSGKQLVESLRLPG